MNWHFDEWRQVKPFKVGGSILIIMYFLKRTELQSLLYSAYISIRSSALHHTTLHVVRRHIGGSVSLFRSHVLHLCSRPQIRFFFSSSSLFGRRALYFVRCWAGGYMCVCVCMCAATAAWYSTYWLAVYSREALSFFWRPFPLNWVRHWRKARNGVCAMYRHHRKLCAMFACC